MDPRTRRGPSDLQPGPYPDTKAVHFTRTPPAGPVVPEMYIDAMGRTGPESVTGVPNRSITPIPPALPNNFDVPNYRQYFRTDPLLGLDVPLNGNVPLDDISPLPLIDPIQEMEQEVTNYLADGGNDDQVNGEAERENDEDPEEEELLRQRAQYKPKSSVPPDLSSANYAAQCISAAISSRMPPFRLSPGEYNVLHKHLSHAHVTTYLNIRNGILRLWLANPTVNVSMVEAAGCVNNERFYPLAEFAYEWLVRNGYINFGCIESAVEPPTDNFVAGKRPRQTIVVVGAGIAGLSCARQLESLLKRYSRSFLSEFEDIPRVVILEAKRRTGGRIYTPLVSGAHVDLGADTIMGFGGGNPLGTLLRRQLGVPCVPIDQSSNDLYSSSGDRIDPEVDYRAHSLFNHLLDCMVSFESGMLAPPTAAGDKALIQAGRDPVVDAASEKITIAHMDEKTKPYDTPPSLQQHGEAITTALESSFLRDIGFKLKSDASQVHISLHAEPSSDSASSLGMTMRSLLKQLERIVEFSDLDKRALDWYFAKFELNTGDFIDAQGLASWSHHRKNRFTGRHSWVRDGMGVAIRAIEHLPKRLDVRLKTPITVIEWEDDAAQVQFENGDQVTADRVIVTAPLGVLKRRSLQFIPDLPQWKTDSIERLGFGVVNRICLTFDEQFWDDQPLIRVANEPTPDERGNCFLFENMARRTGKPLIVGVLSGNAAQKLPFASEEEAVKYSVEKLRNLCKHNSKAHTAKLLESVVTRWQLDPYAKGAFSHVGTEGTVVDHDLLGRPVLQSLFWAGEATSRIYPGTVHGAYLSGLRAAKEVLNSLVGPLEVPNPLILSSENPGQKPKKRRPQVNMSAPHLKKRVAPGPHFHTSVTPPEDFKTAESELLELRRRRQVAEQERLERDLVKELGERPTRPERSGNTNPFLLFQKDYWDICRAETEEAKRNDRRTHATHATRNEIRASLGRKWRLLPELEKRPYIEKSQKTKDENEHRHQEFLRKLKWYDAEADNFRQQWRQDHPPEPTARECQLEALVEEIRPRKKRSRLRE